MGLLNWLKRELDPSPSTKRRLNDAPTNGKKAVLSRNDSYLSALSKFNKWRRLHINTSTTASPKEAFNPPQTIYEEIDLNSKEGCHESSDQNSDKKTVVQSKSKDLTIQETHFHQADDEENESDPEYALPNGFNVPMVQKYIDQKFEFLSEKQQLTACQDVSRGSRIVTDLDKSQDSSLLSCEAGCVETENEYDSPDRTTPVSLNLQLIPELMVLPFSHIKRNKTELGFKVSNGFVQHGEVDSIEISFIQMKEISYNAIGTNFGILRMLRHPNIVLLMGVSMDECLLLEALITEPVRGSLYERVHFEKSRIPIDTCLRYALQITNGIIYLHKYAIIHTNICSQNVVISRDADIVKLTGFELCAVMGDKKDFCSVSTNALCAEYRREYTKHFYQAPELLSATKQRIVPTYQTDVYGLCITLWEMLNCVIPYLQFGYHELIKVFSLKNAMLQTFEEERCSPFKAVLEQGLQIQIENRIPNSVELKQNLREIQLEKRSQQIIRIYKSAEQNINKSQPSNGYQRESFSNRYMSSTGRKSNLSSSETNQSQKRAQNLKCVSFEEPSKSISRLNNTENACSKLTTSSIQTIYEDSYTPHRKYRVNILIRSKSSSSDNSQTEESQTPIACLRKDVAVETDGRARNLQSFFTSTPSFERYGQPHVHEEDFGEF